MATKGRADKAARWREILSRQAGSGLSIRQFCAREGVSEPSFFAWRKKLGERENDDTRTRKSRRGRDKTGNGRLFVPLKLFDSVEALEVIHPLGYRIRVTGDFSPHVLQQVIEVLDRRTEG